MSSITITIYNPQGQPLLVSPDAFDVSRTWLLNDVGVANVSFGRVTPRLQEIVAPGNFLRINQTGLPPWVGGIAQETWEEGNVSPELYSLENELRNKITRQGIVVGQSGGASAGEIARLLFDSAITYSGWSAVRPGELDAPSQHFKIYDYVDLYEEVKKLAEDGGGAFWVDENFLFHFRGSRGQDKRTSVVLTEGVHLERGVKAVKSHQDIVTAAVALGDGNDVPSKPKRARTLRSPYYFRSKVFDVSGALSPEALDGPLNELLQTSGAAITQLDASILNVDSAWSKFWVGDFIRIASAATGIPTLYDVLVTGLEVGQTGAMRGVFKVLTQRTDRIPEEWFIG